MIKKRLVIGICVLALCMLGCKEDKGKESGYSAINAEEFVAGQDSSYMFQMDNNGLLITKTEDGYYFRIGGTLYYADENLETVLALCTKTNCQHREAGKECEGYLGQPGLMSCLQYYNGKLYTDSEIDLITFETNIDEKTYDIYARIYEISADASEKRGLDIISHTVSPIIHRGYAYCYYMESVEEDVNGNTRTVSYAVLARINLESGEEERILDRSTKAVKSSDWIQEIYAYRNYVYFVTKDGEIYLYSLKDGSINQVENLTKVKFWFMDDSIIYRLNTGEDEERKKVYIANLDFSNPKYAFSLENRRYDVGSDNLYIYADNRFISLSEGTDRIIYYYDKNTYEYLGEINLGTGTGIERYGYGDEKYYFYFDETESGSRLMYFKKAALSTGNVELKVLVE